MALTNKEITNLKTDKDIMVGDGNGLYLEVSKTGVKRWWFRYQFNSKSRKMPIDYFPTMSLAEARLEAARLRAILRDADNPQGHQLGADSHSRTRLQPNGQSYPQRFTAMFWFWHRRWLA